MQTPIKLLLIFILSSLFSACATSTQGNLYSSWQLVFENDDQGNTIAGDKQALFDAVRAGTPVRIYTAGSRIEHAAEVVFLSIFDGEVFAQIGEIQSQRPGTEPLQMQFRQPGEKWRSIVGTNGFVTAYIDGNEPRIRTGKTRWFVQR